MKLSIVVPCYNESKDIKDHVLEIIGFLSDKDISYELILVNDGSKDNTQEIIDSLKSEHIIPLGYEKNRGKGGAVKYGIEHASGDYVLFMDADLSTDLKAIIDFKPYFDQYDILIGSRHLKESVLPVKSPLFRRFMSKMCNLSTRVLFGFKFKDTQCGFKVFRKDIINKIIEKQLVTNFAFDVEYLYIAKLNNLTIKELPVRWVDDDSSTVSPIKSSIKFYKDMLKIKANKKKYYFNNTSK